MSKKNFKVETAANGQTTKQDTKHAFATVNIQNDKTPTGKVKTFKDKEAMKAAREEEYKNFRVNALKRRAKRMGLSDEQTKVKVEELLKQMAAPTNYDITIMFNPADYDMVKQALMNDDITWKFLVTTYGFLEGDAEVLASLRKILPPKCKIYPYVKRKPNVLPTQPPRAREAKKRTKAEKKALAIAAKKTRKALNRNKGHNVKSEAKIRLEQFMRDRKAANIARKAAQKASHKAIKAVSGTVVHRKSMKRAKSVKMASTNVKQAA
jgi:hypothetical protein